MTFNAVLGTGMAVLTFSSLTSAHSGYKEPIDVTFENEELRTGTEINVLDGLLFSGFVALEEAGVAQMLQFNGSKAAVASPGGNRITAQPGDPGSDDRLFYADMTPEGVSVGCYTNPEVGKIFGEVPLSDVGLGELADALKASTGAAALARTCTVRVRVVEMETDSDDPRLADLQAAGHDYVDCHFTAKGIVPGQGTGTVSPCDLTRYDWSGTSALNFTVQSVGGLIDTGTGGGIGSTLLVIDDFRAVGTVPPQDDG